MEPQSRPQALLADLATRQHGVVAHRQLLRLGRSEGAVKKAVRANRLHPIYRGVYSVGHRDLSANGHLMAAVLACGPTALLSYRSAARHWGLIRSAPALIDVTVPHGTRRRHRGIRMHRSRTLTDEDRDVVDAIPVTSVPRTLLDLAAVGPRQMDQALENAERLRLFDLMALHSLLERCGGHPGAKRLRRALALYMPLPYTRSELERRFLRRLEESALPAPSVNAFVAGYEVDMFWPQHRLVVELDGYEFHRTRAAFERDHRRAAELRLAGCEVIRITALRFAADPAGAIAGVAAIMARRAAQSFGVE